MPRYRPEFNPRVSEELVSHARFIARVSRPAAEHFYQEFEAILKRLQENPLQFPPYESPNLPANFYHRVSFAKWYSIIFYNNSATVIVDAVMDGRSNLANE